MSNRKFIIIFSLVAVLLIGSVVYLGIDLFGKKDTKKTTEEITPKNNIFSFLDFTKKSDTSIVDTNTSPTDASEAQGEAIVTKKLIRLSSKKVSSYDFFDKETKIPSILNEKGEQEFITIGSKGLRFIDKETGLIYELLNNATENTRFSNNTTPLLGKSLIGNNATSIVFQYVDEDGETIETYTGKVEGSLIPYNIRGFFLPKNITDISLSPKKDQFFSIVPTNTGVIGLTQYFDNNKKAQPWSSVFTEWVSDWSNDTVITLTTKPSGQSDGYSYFLNLKDSKFTKMIGPEKGLSTKTSPDTKNILYSKIQGGQPNLFIYNTITKTSKNLNFVTLAEKCTWKDASIIYCAVPNILESGIYPDKWYRGEVSFEDSLWKIDVVQNIQANIANESQIINIDAVDLKVRDEYLYFINKKTETLWKYIISE